MTQPTHAIIDGKNHLIVSITEMDGAAHTHRIKFACGLGYDLRDVKHFELHAADHGDPLSPLDPKLVKAAQAFIPAVEEAATALNKVGAEHGDAEKQLLELRQKCAVDEPLEADVIAMAKLEIVVRRLSRRVEKLAQAADEANNKYAVATEAIHKARTGRDQRWLTHSDAKPVKLTCPGCIAAPPPPAPEPEPEVEAA